MNLVGNLEDLGLGEILQIVSLSRKSGILTLTGLRGEGEIVFSQGEVIRASSPEYGESLAELLIAREAVDRPTMESACSIQETEGFRERLGTILEKRFNVPAETIEGAIRERIECIVGSFFGWTAGTFDFELHEHADLIDSMETEQMQFVLEQGINSQYLAIEGLRLQDAKCLHGKDVASAPPISTEAPPAGMNAGSSSDSPVDDFPRPEEIPLEPDKRHVVVLVDDHAATREELAATLEACGYEVYPFSGGADTPLMRLASLHRDGVTPTILIDMVMAKMDGTGIMGGIELLDLIRANFPDIPVLAMSDLGNEEAERELRRSGCPLIMKPGEDEVGDPGVMNEFMAALLPALIRVRCGGERFVTDENVNLGDELRHELGEAPGIDPAPVVQSTGIALLRGMLEELNDPALGVGITLLVLRFAAEFMNRGVIFTVKSNRIEGLGQFGINAEMGSADSIVRGMKIPRNEDSLFARVLDSRSFMKIAPDGGDWTGYVLDGLGGGSPAEIFLGPIVSEGKVVAILYGDNLPEQRPIGDTDSLEIFLSQAGVAMERAFLQRKLKGLGLEGT